MFGKMQNAMFSSGKQSGPDVGMPPPGGGSPVMGGGGGAGGMALTADGEVLSFGRFAYGRLGRPMDANADARDGDAACPAPARVSFPAGEKTRIARVAAGMSHSACVDDDGTLFVFGSGDGYMLGRGDDEDDAAAPVAVGTTDAYAKHWDPAVRKVSRVSLGGMHIMAITRPGR
mgnify:CR=1 FL=1